MAKLGNVLKLARCPHCGIAHPFLPKLHELITTNSDGQNQRDWCFYGCKSCGGVITASALRGNPIAQTLYPAQASVDECVPDKAREFLSQAIDSLHAPAGAVMLTASSVDAMLKAKNYAEGSLYTRINQAVEDHLITAEMAEWAHDVRLDANDQRHADEEAELPSKDQARKCIDFAQALAQFLFVLPARVERGLRDAQQGGNEN